MNFSTEVIAKLLEVYRAESALINENGEILAESKGWAELTNRNQSETGGAVPDRSFSTANGFVNKGTDPLQVKQGVESVLNGAKEDFIYIYESEAVERPKWYCLRATRFSPCEEIRWAVLTHTELAEKGVGHEDLVIVCGWCKRIPEGEKWITFEEYFSKQAGIRFSHGICPGCRDRILQES